MFMVMKWVLWQVSGMNNSTRLLAVSLGWALVGNSIADDSNKDIRVHFDPDQAFAVLLQSPHGEHEVISLAQADSRWVKPKSLTVSVNSKASAGK
jgi:hypothetical protein